MTGASEGVELSQIPNPQARTREMVWRAERALSQGRIGERRELLLGALSDDFPPLRRRAALLLAEGLGEDSDARDALAALALDASLETSAAAAALALRGAPGEDTARVLRRVWREDRRASVRYEALVSLFMIGEGAECAPEAIEDSDDDLAVVGAQIAAARELVSARDAILARRERLRASARLQATLALVELEAASPGGADEDRIAEWVEELASALKREETSAAAARALGWLAATGHCSERARRALRARLASFLLHPILKVEIAAALTQAGDPEGIAHLERAFKSRRKGAKGYAIEIAGRFALEGFYDEVAAIAHSTDYHNETAAIALCAYDTERARVALAEIARGHPDESCRELAEELIQDGTIGHDEAQDVGVLFRSRSHGA